MPINTMPVVVNDLIVKNFLANSDAINFSITCRFYQNAMESNHGYWYAKLQNDFSLNLKNLTPTNNLEILLWLQSEMVFKWQKTMRNRKMYEIANSFSVEILKWIFNSEYDSPEDMKSDRRDLLEYVMDRKETKLRVNEWSFRTEDINIAVINLLTHPNQGACPVVATDRIVHEFLTGVCRENTVRLYKPIKFSVISHNRQLMNVCDVGVIETSAPSLTKNHF